MLKNGEDETFYVCLFVLPQLKKCFVFLFPSQMQPFLPILIPGSAVLLVHSHLQCSSSSIHSYYMYFIFWTCSAAVDFAPVVLST